jgi:hypothetical protein
LNFIFHTREIRHLSSLFLLSLTFSFVVVAGVFMRITAVFITAQQHQKRNSLFSSLCHKQTQFNEYLLRRFSNFSNSFFFRRNFHIVFRIIPPTSQLDECNMKWRKGKLFHCCGTLFVHSTVDTQYECVCCTWDDTLFSLARTIKQFCLIIISHDKMCLKLL